MRHVPRGNVPLLFPYSRKISADPLMYSKKVSFQPFFPSRTERKSLYSSFLASFFRLRQGKGKFQFFYGQDARRQASGASCQLSVAGHWLLVTGYWLPVAGCQLSVVSCQLPVVSCQLSVASCQLSVVSCQLSVAGCQLPVVRFQLSVAGHWLLVTGYWLLVTGCWLPVVSLKSQDAGGGKPAFKPSFGRAVPSRQSVLRFLSVSTFEFPEARKPRSVINFP